jgi:2-keto-4-pentenoate hydratase
MSRYVFGLFLLVLATGACAAAVSPNTFVQQIELARQSRQPLPSASTEFEGLDEDHAFALQHRFILTKLRKGDAIAGFKAGFMTPVARERNKLDHPVFGVLLRSARHDRAQPLPRDQFSKPILETEIGFVFDKPVTQSVKDVATLRTFIRSIQPTIEVPDGSIASSEHPGLDLIAANVAASRFVPGMAVAVSDLDLKTVTVRLYRDGALVTEGAGTDAYGDPWQSLLWMTNAVVQHGYKIQPGQLIITGTLGKAPPAETGLYTADYGVLGKMNFRVQ